MSSKTYHMTGKEIFYGNEDSTRLVAILDDDGNPVFETGMAGPHTQRLKAWMETWPSIKTDEPEAECDLIPDETVAHEEEPNTDLLNDHPSLPSDGNTTVFVGSVPVAMVTGQRLEEKKVLFSGDDWVIQEIPENRLPPFDKAQGVNTPGFQEFVKGNRLSEAQIAALVNRMEKR